MKEGFDREIDWLLRRHGRGTAESRLWGNGAGDGAQGMHLDADELSAFAEGALPAAARVAAASHLADCERCRGVAVGLARVAGAEAEVKHQAVAATAATQLVRTSAWRALLSSLFSPRAMRFAVPVLALSLVGVVSYVALRSKSGGALQMTTDAGRKPGVLQPQPNASVAQSGVAANANTSSFDDQNGNAVPKGAPALGVQPGQTRGHGGVEAPTADGDAARKDEPASEETAAAAPPPPPPASVAAEGPAEVSKAAPKPVTSGEDEVARNESRDKSENKEKSARAAEPVDDLAMNDATQRNRAAQRSVNQMQMPDGGERTQKRADNSPSNVYRGGENTGSAAAPRESDRAGSRGAGRSRAAKEAEKKADTEESGRSSDTRTAAGHRFRREGNRWVDVNYRDSMSSTGARRGTEAFRALVADVPEVGRVAAAINGEVIVVVGGRAYHIR